MYLSKQEITKLIHFTDVYRNDCERKIRKIRRNKILITDRFNEIPSAIAEEEGISHPDVEIESLKSDKAEAVIIKKKLQLLRAVGEKYENY